MTNPIETLQALVDALFESHPAVAVSGTEAQESKHYAALTAGRSLLAQLKAQPSDDLHEAILNLPITRLRNQITDWRNGYKEGHKDARHAGAELVLAHQGAQPAVVRTTAVRVIARLLALHEHQSAADATKEAERLLDAAGALAAAPSAQPAVPDAATKGWLAALSDARYAARGNEWLVSKLAEIHVHLAAAPSASAQPQRIDMKLLQEIEGEFVRLEHLPAFIRRLQDRLRAALAASAQEPQGQARDWHGPLDSLAFEVLQEPQGEAQQPSNENIAKRAVEIAKELRRALPPNTDFADGWQERYLDRQNARFEQALEMAQGEAQQPESRKPLSEEHIDSIARDGEGDLPVLADLICTVAKAGTNGQALAALMSYRKNTRTSAIRTALAAAGIGSKP